MKVVGSGVFIGSDQFGGGPVLVVAPATNNSLNLF